MKSIYTDVANIKQVSFANELTASEFKFQTVLERFVHFQFSKLFHELGGRSKFLNAFLVVLPDDFFMSDVSDELSNQSYIAKQLSTDFVTVEVLQVSLDDFFQPTVELGVSIEPFTESVWDCLRIELTTSPDAFHVTRIDFGNGKLKPDEAQWFELTDHLEDYLANECTVWKHS